MLTSLRLESTSDDDLHEVTVVSESIQWAADSITSFIAYAGETTEGEPIFLPYVLTTDTSNFKREAIHKATNIVTTGLRTAKGYEKGYNAPSAISQGLKEMRASALRGASKGFLWGVVISAVREVSRHVLFSNDRNKQHYYVSSHGPIFYGPLRRKSKSGG